MKPVRKTKTNKRMKQVKSFNMRLICFFALIAGIVLFAATGSAMDMIEMADVNVTEGVENFVGGASFAVVPLLVTIKGVSGIDDGTIFDVTKGFEGFKQLKGINDAAFKEMKPGDISKLYSEFTGLTTQAMAEFAEKAGKDSEEYKETLEKMTKVVAELQKADYAAIKASLIEQGKEMAKLVERIESETKNKSIGFKAALLKGLEENKDKIAEMLKDGSGRIKLEIKASQSAGDISTGQDFAQMEPGVGQIATRQTFMRMLFPNRPTTKEYVKYNDQETVVRDAKNVAGCAASVHNSKITWKVREMKVEKIRDFVDICIDMMDDYEFVGAEVNALVSTDVALKVDSQLLLGDNISPNLNSVSNVASAFAAGGYALSIQDAQLIDLLKIGGAQISDFGQNNKFLANIILLNPIDACKMQLLKDKDGNYMVPNWITQDGVNIGSMRVIQNQLVPANEAYIFDSSKGVVYGRRGAVVEMAFENKDNFEKELVTVKAYERLNFRVRNVDLNAFLHIPDLAAAIIAIKKV